MSDLTTAATTATAEYVELTLNGRSVRVAGLPPTTSVLEWLRRSGLTGTKCGCDEGDCGACTILLVEREAGGRATYRAVNSCLVLLPMLAGREVLTVEGVARDPGAGEGGDALHPVQRCLAEHYGSQCGYCTPGVVVSMLEGYYRRGLQQPWQIADQLCGNLCRCTGYRPIRDAMAAALRHRSTAAADGDPLWRRLREPVAPLAAFAYAAAGERFVRPGSLDELLALIRQHPDAPLVTGATELGVMMNKAARRFPVLISTEGVPELTRITSTATEWRIGGSATLTDVEDTLGGEYPSLAKMLSVFASRQIRNRATLAGNLVTASPIGDAAPVLMTLEASVVLASALGERRVAVSDLFTGYRATQLRPGEMMKEIVLPRPDPGSGLVRRADFQKVSHRRELDSSIVAGAFCIDCDPATSLGPGDPGIVRRARLAYGGVAAMPVRARAAEAALEGRRLAGAAPAVAALLADAFEPIDDVRGSAAYRRGVAVSLWEKFAAGETSLAVDAVPTYTAGATWPAPDASRRLHHESAVGHVTGRALYVDDMARQRPMLDVWPVMAPCARARITRRDVQAALLQPGIVAVLTAADIPGHNQIGVVRHDEPLLADDEVQYHGQIVALVVGESVTACRAAAALVVAEYEPLAPVLTIQEALAADSFHTEPRLICRGDCEGALAAAPHRLSGGLAIGGQDHLYLETQAAWAECGDAGDVRVCSSTQHPSEIQAVVAEVLHLPRNKVVVESPRMGGGFGGKESQAHMAAALVALAALKTGRPVRVQFDRDVDMALTGKRHPFHAEYDVGFDDDGQVLAVRLDLVSNGGWSLDLSQPILDRALFHVDNAYYLPAVHLTGRVAKTNLASNTAFRGFGGPQGMLVIEEVMDRVARALGLPPEVVRSRNLYHGTGETNTTHYGEAIEDTRIQDLWGRVQEQARWPERRAEVDAWNRAHARIRRGLAITPVKFGISFTLSHYNQGGALVHVYQDGSVQVNHGGTEMGQGLHTKILGVAMRELGLPASSLRVMRTSTDKVPNTPATAASSGADLNGAAVRAACRTLRERMAPVAARLLAATIARQASPTAARADPPPAGQPGGAATDAVRADEVRFTDGSACLDRTDGGRVSVPFAAVAAQCHVERVSLSATGYYATPGIHWNWQTVSGRPFAYYACGAAVSEVEVDGYTGMTRVRRVDIVHDTGDSLNPGIDRGQIEGGFVQGMGWLTSEELKWDAAGRLLTHGASTYQIPAISDAPMELNVTLLPAAANPHAVDKSKAVGEPPLMLALSVREAIRDAVASFGPPGGDVPLPSPATSEAVFLAIQQRLARRPADS